MFPHGVWSELSNSSYTAKLIFNCVKKKLSNSSQTINFRTDLDHFPCINSFVASTVLFILFIMIYFIPDILASWWNNYYYVLNTFLHRFFLLYSVDFISYSKLCIPTQFEIYIYGVKVQIEENWTIFI